MADKKYENYIEKMVRDEMKTVYEREKDLCKCDKCYQDIITLTLNNLPPMYVSSNVGHIMTMYNLTKDQLQAQVTVELLKAVELVKKSPKH